MDKLSAAEYSPKKTIRAASSTPTLNNWQSLSTTMADAVSPVSTIPWPNTRDEYTLADVIGKNLSAINQSMIIQTIYLHSFAFKVTLVPLPRSVLSSAIHPIYTISSF